MTMVRYSAESLQWEFPTRKLFSGCSFAPSDRLPVIRAYFPISKQVLCASVFQNKLTFLGYVLLVVVGVAHIYFLVTGQRQTLTYRTITTTT